MARLRIGIVSPIWLRIPPPGYGGIERVVHILAEELTRRGHDVTLFALGGSVTDARLVSFLESAPPMDDPGAFADELFHTVSAYRLADRFDVIHDHTSIGPALGAILGGVPPVVHTLHGPWTARSRRFAGLVQDRVHLVAISRSQAQGNPAVPYAAVVHNGVDLADYPFSSVKGDYLAYVGRASPEKGTHLAVEIASLAGMPLKMAVKRVEEAEWAYWEQMVAPRLTGTEEIFDQPDHARKWEILAHARATLFPIDWAEPFGLVMVESMACGTPVIARPLGAAPEVVVDGVTGFLRLSVEELAEAARRTCTLDPRHCRRVAETRFSATSMVDGYEQVYRSVIGGDPAVDPPTVGSGWSVPVRNTSPGGSSDTSNFDPSENTDTRPPPTGMWSTSMLRTSSGTAGVMESEP